MYDDLFKPAIENLSRRARRARRREKLGQANVVHDIYPGLGLSSDTSRGWSNNIWHDCPFEAFRANPTEGMTFWDDFTDNSFAGTQTTEIIQGRYKLYNTGAAKINLTSSFNSTITQGGIVSLTIDTDGDAAAIGTQSCPFVLNPSTAKKLWFEARVASLSIATNDGQLFVGLGENAEVTFGAATPLANANATSTGDAKIGFNRLEDGLGVLNTSYADRAAAWTDVQASAASMTALNWIKLGMVFDPNNSAKCVRFYADGVETTTPLSKTALEALSHVDTKGLGPVAAVFGDSGAAAVLYIDWIRVAQRL